MSNPGNQPGDPYHPGPAWGGQYPVGGQPTANPQDAGGYAQPGGYQYPTGGQYSQYGAQPPQPPVPQPQPLQPQPTQYQAYPPNVTGPWAAYAQQGPAPSAGRPKVLTAAAALSLLTGSTIGVAGTGLLTAAAAAGATRSALSTSLGTSGLASRYIAFAAIIAVIMLATAFILLWGAIDAALARGTLLAIIGNIITAVLALIVIVQTSAWLLIWLILPIVAVIMMVQPSVRNYLANRPLTD